MINPNKFLRALRALRRTLSPNCREAARLQSEAMDRPLSGLSRFGLAMHVGLCRWCRRYGRHLHGLRKLAREHPEELTTVEPRAMADEAKERMKAVLRRRADEH